MNSSTLAGSTTLITGAGGRGGRGFACARAAVAALAMPTASYLTGQVIVVGGGNSIADENGA